MHKLKIKVPLSVPKNKRNEFQLNYEMLTNYSGRLFLIAGDQKVEHLNADFVGPKISPEDQSPEHLFKIAAASQGGVLATHLGLIAQYGSDYPDTPYLVKLNGKTNIGRNELKDSSHLWWTVEDVIKFKKESNLKIVGIGYTLYLGGQYEAEMLATVAQALYQAHQAGLTTLLWVYPRGPKINEENIHTIAGGAGIASALGSDFVKIKYPYAAKNKLATAQKFREATKAAGRTKVVCVGGQQRPVKLLLDDLARQIKISKTNGLAMGRNLHQRSLTEATRLTAALGSIIFHDQSAAEAYKIYNRKNKLPVQSRGRFLGLF